MNSYALEPENSYFRTDNRSGNWLTPVGKEPALAVPGMRLIRMLPILGNVISSLAFDPFVQKRWEDELVVSINISSYLPIKALISTRRAREIALEVQRLADERKYQHALQESETLTRLLEGL